MHPFPKHFVKTVALLPAILFPVLTQRALAAELVANGNFSLGFDGWTNASVYFNGTPYVGGLSLIDDGPHVSAAKLRGVDGTNYDVRLEQFIPVANLTGPIEISFDWKVTVKESSWGVNYVVVDFHNEAATIIGRVIHFDTSNPNYTLEYFRNWLGGPPANAYYGVRKFHEVFDWESISVTSDALPGLDISEIRQIHVRLDIQNDSTRGGEMLVDNVSVRHSPIVDCNSNGIDDSIDIASGASFDCLNDGIPDECQLISEECPFLLGDTSNDGEIDQDDVLQFVLVLLNHNECFCSVQAADMNGDGQVDARDIRPFQAVVRCHLGLAQQSSTRPAQTANILELADEVGAELDLGTLLLEQTPHRVTR